MWDSIKILWGNALAAILAYFAPIDSEFTVLVILFSANFIVGLLTDLIANGDGFKIKKAFRCILELTCFVCFIAAMYSIGKVKGAQDGTIQCVSYVTWVVIWFYTCNVLRNLCALFSTGSIPHKVFSLLYFVVSVEFIKNIPFLSNYLKAREEVSKNPTAQDNSGIIL